MQIHHIVLKRIDGSEVRQKFVAAVSTATPRVGSTFQLSISNDRHVRVSAKVVAVQKVTFASRDGRTGTVDVTVHAQELTCVPVADNDS